MRAHLVVDRSACAMLADHHIARDQSVWALVMMMMLMLIPKIHGLIPHPCQRYTIHTLPLLPPPSLPFVASSPFSYPPRHRLSPHYLLHLGHLGIVKGVADAQEAVGLLAGHAALLGQVRLAVEDVVGPALGGLVHELELVVEVGQGLGVVLLEPGQLLGGGLGLLGEGVELPELFGARLALLLPTALGVGQLGLGLGDGGADLLDGGEVLLVLELEEAVLLAGEGPEVVGPAALGLVDEAIVYQGLVDVGAGVAVDAGLGREGDDLLLGVDPVSCLME